jgi:hypothetical protein
MQIEIHRWVQQEQPPTLIGSTTVSLELANFVSRW